MIEPSKITLKAVILLKCVCVQQPNQHSSRTANVSQCQQTHLQLVLIEPLKNNNNPNTEP